MSEQAFGRVALESVTTAIKDGTHGTHARVSGGVPFLSAKNITAAGAVSWDEEDDCISDSEYEQIHRTFQPRSKDLLLTIVGSLGRRAVFDGSRVAFQRSVAFVRPDALRVSEQFLFHWFAHAEFQNELVRRSNSTAQAGLYLGELAQTLVPNCALAEQEKIAGVLDAVDTTIRQIEAIIEKLKQVNQGLLHDLLTRGIDANGELRPPQSEAPHLYKESPIGWIPREWGTCLVGDEVDIRHGFAFPGNLFTSEPKGHRILVPGNFSRFGGLDFSDGNTKYFAGKHPPDTLLESGEALIVMTDLSPHTLILGRAVVLDESFPVLHNQRIGKFIFRRSTEWNTEFFVMLMNDERLRRKVIAEATGTTVRHTSPDRIRSGVAPKPRPAEQAEVVRRASALAGRIFAEAAYVLKLRNEKSGVMDDLLTGRVRVTPLLA